MIGIVLAAVLKVGYILICKVIVMIIFAVLAIRYWVGEDIRKAEEEKRGTWLFTLGFIGLTVLTMLAANIEYSNAIVHAFQRFRAPFSGKIVHIFPEQSAVI